MFIFKEDDPFWEPADLDVIIGVASLPLKFLSYMIEFKEDPLTVLDYTAQHCGFLEVQLVPCDKKGNEGSDFAVDDPSDLVCLLFRYVSIKDIFNFFFCILCISSLEFF
jgi:hypothetical protein